MTKKPNNKKITNWSQYNRSLMNRGRFSIWIDEDAKDKWYHKGGRIGQGRVNTYSDDTVMLMAILSELYSLPYRQTEGLLRDIVEHSEYSDLPVPGFAILTKRGKKLNMNDTLQQIQKLKKQGEEINICMDATGIKIFGEYEWKVRTHGKGKRRKWLKLHASIDRDTRQVIACSVTDSSIRDGKEFCNLLKQAKGHNIKINTCYADGAYHWHNIFKYLDKANIAPRIPLPKNAVLTCEHRPEDAQIITNPRDRALLQQHDAGGLEQWKKETDYHQRSLIENLFSRFKLIFGERIPQRLNSIRKMRVQLRLHLLNTFAAMGLPSYT